MAVWGTGTGGVGRKDSVGIALASLNTLTFIVNKSKSYEEFNEMILEELMLKEESICSICC